MTWWLPIVVLVVGALASACERPPTDQATMVLRNGKIVTVNDRQADARAMAIRGETILAVGSDQDIEPYINAATEIIDLAGGTAIPGFIDGHGHFMGVGESRQILNLTTVKSWDDIVQMVQTAAAKAKPGDWILGRGWHQEKWDQRPRPAVEGFPVHASLSKVSPNNPVLLEHASGHATFANERAMELAGVTSKTANPPGGEILKDSRGNPTGLFRETASEVVQKVYDTARAVMTREQLDSERRKIIRLADEEALSNGVTTFHDAGASFETIDLYRRIVEEGTLGVRLWVMINEPNERLADKLPQYRLVGLGSQHLTVGGIKKIMDGALGSRGAWLLEPYTDQPSSTGLPTISVTELRETAELAMQNAFQVCVHAIGDRANREVLDVFEVVFKMHPERKDVRWRIEHAQHLDEQDIPRFGRLGVLASMQGIHATSDAPFVIPRLGEARSAMGAYVWQKLMQSRAVIVNGTDVPVENVNPIANFYASVTRKTSTGDTFFPDQRMSRAEALKSYTWNGAYAAFEDRTKGSLEPGKLADVTVLSQDIMTIPEEQILDTRVLYTIVGGRVRYKRPSATMSSTQPSS